MFRPLTGLTTPKADSPQTGGLRSVRFLASTKKSSRYDWYLNDCLIVHVAPANKKALDWLNSLPQSESQLRIAVIDENPVRAAIIEDGLAEVGERDVFVISERSGMARAIETIDPDVILIDLGNPSRDMLEEYFAVSRAVSRPIAMFVEQSDDDTIAAAIDAGVSAYIVDGLSQRRMKPILDLAVRRFQAFSRLQSELKEARDALSDRTIIDNAKRILIQKRKISEPEAHKLLRNHAMNSNKRMAEVAEAIVTAEKLLGGGL